MDSFEKIKELREQRDNLTKEINKISREIDNLKFENYNLSENIKLFPNHCRFINPDDNIEYIGYIEDWTVVERKHLLLKGKFLIVPSNDYFTEFISEINILDGLKEDIMKNFLENIKYIDKKEFNEYLVEVYLQKVLKVLTDKFDIKV